MITWLPFAIACSLTTLQANDKIPTPIVWRPTADATMNYRYSFGFWFKEMLLEFSGDFEVKTSEIENGEVKGSVREVLMFQGHDRKKLLLVEGEPSYPSYPFQLDKTGAYIGDRPSMSAQFGISAAERLFFGFAFPKGPVWKGETWSLPTTRRFADGEIKFESLTTYTFLGTVQLGEVSVRKVGFQLRDFNYVGERVIGGTYWIDTKTGWIERFEVESREACDPEAWHGSNKGQYAIVHRIK